MAIINEKLHKMIFALRERDLITNEQMQNLFMQIHAERVLLKDAVYELIGSHIAVPRTKEFIDKFEKL